jgi:hypothetical protein
VQVSPVAEPSVVEDEPFDADFSGAVGEYPTAVDFVVEVHRLPGVQDHRAEPAATSIARERAQRAVKPAGHGVETAPIRGV